MQSPPAGTHGCRLLHDYSSLLSRGLPSTSKSVVCGCAKCLCSCFEAADVACFSVSVPAAFPCDLPAPSCTAMSSPLPFLGTVVPNRTILALPLFKCGRMAFLRTCFCPFISQMSALHVDSSSSLLHSWSKGHTQQARKTIPIAAVGACRRAAVVRRHTVPSARGRHQPSAAAEAAAGTPAGPALLGASGVSLGSRRRYAAQE